MWNKTISITQKKAITEQGITKYSFEYNGENYVLTYNSTSCGDFGSRYYVRITRTKDDKTIYDFDVDNVSRNREDELYFSDEFDVSFFYNLLDSELKEYIDFNSYDEILDFHVVDCCDYFDDEDDEEQSFGSCQVNSQQLPIFLFMKKCASAFLSFFLGNHSQVPLHPPRLVNP